MQEYEGFDADLYDTYTIYEEDIPFYVEMAKSVGGPAMELGCGTGRILIPIAEAGVEITGLDLSADMLAIAKQKISALHKDIQKRIILIKDDMKNFKLDQSFKLITIPFRAFLHLMTIEDQKKALSNIRDHLADDGKFVFNIFDPNIDIISTHRGYMGQALKKMAEFKHPQTGNQVLEWDTRQYNLTEQTINEMRLFEEIDSSGKIVNRHYVPLTLRFVYRYEMQHLLELCGYEIEALYGDFQHGSFKHGGEQVWICMKA